MSGIKEFKRLNTRKASVVHVGGFRPSGDPLASHFGLRPLGAEGEDWPTMDGKPLLFVCQLNLTAAPAVPALLQDIALITFFVDPEFGNLTKENGVDWCLRGYPSLSGLVAMTPPADAAKLNADSSAVGKRSTIIQIMTIRSAWCRTDSTIRKLSWKTWLGLKWAGIPAPFSRSHGGDMKSIPAARRTVYRSTAKGEWDWRGAPAERYIWRGARRRDAESSGSSTGSAAGVR